MKLICTNIEICGYKEIVSDISSVDENISCPLCQKLVLIYEDDYEPYWLKGAGWRPFRDSDPEAKEVQVSDRRKAKRKFVS